MRKKLWRGRDYSHAFSDVRKKNRNALKLQKGFKEENAAVRPLEGFRRKKEMHALPVLIEEVERNETT